MIPEMRADDTVVSVTVVTGNPEHATRAAEVLARAASGLSLEGINVSLTMSTVFDEDAA